MLDQAEIRFLHGIRDRVTQEMKGIDEIINLLLIALVVRGHVLLEGNPGLGKTALIRSLSNAMDFKKEHVGRIQFTPDLMPSDITGTKMPVDDGALKFQKGPIFCRLLLADEINRATPKTQAAMLEAMAEFQVTVLGERYRLSKTVDVHDGASVSVQTPFLVMATQNPVEQEGTYELPEAQLDRFLFKAVMPFPKRDTLEAIVRKDAGVQKLASGEDVTKTLNEDATLANIHRFGRGLREAEPSQEVQMHIMNIILASVGDFAEMEGLSATSDQAVREFYAQWVRYELGPRAATSLTLAALGWAAIAEVEPSEVSQLPVKTMDALAKIAVPVLRHRMRFELDFEDQANLSHQHDAMVRRFVVLCAPAQDGYAARFQAASQAAAKVARF